GSSAAPRPRAQSLFRRCSVPPWIQPLTRPAPPPPPAPLPPHPVPCSRPLAGCPVPGGACQVRPLPPPHTPPATDRRNESGRVQPSPLFWLRYRTGAVLSRARGSAHPAAAVKRVSS